MPLFFLNLESDHFLSCVTENNAKKSFFFWFSRCISIFKALTEAYFLHRSCETKTKTKKFIYVFSFCFICKMIMLNLCVDMDAFCFSFCRTFDAIFNKCVKVHLQMTINRLQVSIFYKKNLFRSLLLNLHLPHNC